MVVAVLAVQGAFAEQESMLERLGVQSVELRKKEDLQKHYDGIILPGGESTVQGKLLRELSMYDTIRQQIADGMPVLATCAGMILLAEQLENDERRYFQTLPVTVRRNAYGRQLGSFFTEQEFAGIGRVPMTFIRAPFVTEARGETRILARVDGKIVAVQYQNQIALAFHPELDEDTRIHQYFLDMIRNHRHTAS